jgi:hypothetical protein
VLAEFQLDSHFNQTAYQDDPKSDEATFRSQYRSGNEFTRTYYGGGEDETRTKKTEFTAERNGRFLDARLRHIYFLNVKQMA